MITTPCKEIVGVTTTTNTTIIPIKSVPCMISPITAYSVMYMCWTTTVYITICTYDKQALTATSLGFHLCIIFLCGCDWGVYSQISTPAHLMLTNINLQAIVALLIILITTNDNPSIKWNKLWLLAKLTVVVLHFICGLIKSCH